MLVGLAFKGLYSAGSVVMLWIQNATHSSDLFQYP